MINNIICLLSIKLNGRYYIGVTNGRNKSYKGSGTALKTAIKKYGSDNFVTETLEVFENETDMFDREAEIVNEDFVANPLTYNMKLGGRGGKGSTKTDTHKANISKSILKKKEEGTLVSNGGRKLKMPREEILALVDTFGIIGAAAHVNEPYHTFRSRYYNAKKNLPG